jgi:aldehyde:ferredoxin oxidoreductase
MLFGWTGNILRIDLSNKRSSTESTEPYTQSFIGGKGINVKIMYDEVGPEIGPFDPENRICFGPGVLAGTLAPAHSRMKIASVSPNGHLQNSGIGGYIPAEIRKAGYDNLIIQGKSDKPIYLYIDNDKVEIRDATHLWGKDTQETQRAIKGEIGDWVKIACIGPAGENLVSFSTIVTGVGSVAGRGGFGAIMGSKNLKAIGVKGSGQVRVARPSEFLSACKEISLWLPESTPVIKSMSKDGHGDKWLINYGHESGLGVTGNWEEKDVSLDKIGDFGGADEFYDEFATHQYGCFGCPMHHFHIFHIPGRCRGATKCAQWAFSGPVWVNDRKVIVQAGILCNNYGLDSGETCNAVSFLMELYYRGIISEKDTDGIAMRRGDENAIFTTIEKIGKQEGFGRFFKKGVWGAAKEIGKEAEECAVVVNGQVVEPYEVRAYKSSALAAALTDGTARYGGFIAEYLYFGDKERAEKIAQEITGSREAAVPTSYGKKAQGTWDYENRNTAIDLLGTCSYFIPVGVTHKLDIPAKLFSLATGRDTSEEDLLWASQRILTLERAFRVKRGIRRDALPRRLFETTVPYGIFKGERLDREKFEKMLDEYYSLRGWDKDGIPTEETFKKFDLSSEWESFSRNLKKETIHV